MLNDLIGKKLKFLVCVLFLIGNGFLFAQDSEAELKQKAEKSYQSNDFEQATTSFLKLLALQPRDSYYNLRYGTCLLYNAEKKQDAIRYLEFSSKQEGTDPEVFFFLGKAYHLNYRFDDAINSYETYKSKTGTKGTKLHDVDKAIAESRNGKTLLASLNELVVFDKKNAKQSEFYRMYKLDKFTGSIVVGSTYQSKIDKKKGFTPIIYFPPNPTYVFFASYGESEATGKDIYFRTKNAAGAWQDAVKIATNVNTNFDEDFPFFNPIDSCLYFSSKGHNSMGGFDIFKCPFDLNTGKAGTVQNLDFPVSSSDDDLFYMVDSLGEKAYFASARQSANGKIHVYEVQVKSNPSRLIAIQGKVTNLVQGDVKSIEVFDQKTNQSVGVFEVDEAGNYLVILPKSGDYRYEISTQSKEVLTTTISIPKQATFKPLSQEIVEKTVQGASQIQVETKYNEPIGDTQRILAEVIKKQAELTPNATILGTEESNSPQFKKAIAAIGLSGLSEEEVKQSLTSAIQTQTDFLKTAEENQQKTLQIIRENGQEIAGLQNEIKRTTNKANETTNPTEKKEFYLQAEKAIVAIEELQQENNLLFKTLDSMQVVIETKEKEIQKQKSWTDPIQNNPAISSAELTTVIEKNASEIKTTLINQHPNPVAQKSKEVLDQDKLVKSKQAELSNYTGSKNQLETEIASLQTQLNTAKSKEKPEIEQNIAQKSSELELISQAATRSEKATKAAQEKLTVLQDQLAQLQTIQQAKKPDQSLSKTAVQSEIAAIQTPNQATLANYVRHQLEELATVELQANTTVDPTKSNTETNSNQNTTTSDKNSNENGKPVEPTNSEKTFTSFSQQNPYSEFITEDWKQTEERYLSAIDAIKSDKNRSETDKNTAIFDVEVKQLENLIAELDAVEKITTKSEKNQQFSSFLEKEIELTEARIEKQMESLERTSATNSNVATMTDPTDNSNSSGTKEVVKINPIELEKEVIPTYAAAKVALDENNELDPIERKKAQLALEEEYNSTVAEELELKATLLEIASNDAEKRQLQAEINTLNDLQKIHQEQQKVFENELNLLEKELETVLNSEANQPKVGSNSEIAIQLESELKTQLSAIENNELLSPQEELKQRVQVEKKHQQTLNEAKNKSENALKSDPENKIIQQEIESLENLRLASETRMDELLQAEVSAEKNKLNPTEFQRKIDKSYAVEIEKLDVSKANSSVETEIILNKKIALENQLQVKFQSKLESNEKAIAKKSTPQLLAENQLINELIDASNQRVESHRQVIESIQNGDLATENTSTVSSENSVKTTNSTDVTELKKDSVQRFVAVEKTTLEIEEANLKSKLVSVQTAKECKEIESQLKSISTEKTALENEILKQDLSEKALIVDELSNELKSITIQNESLEEQRIATLKRVDAVQLELEKLEKSWKSAKNPMEVQLEMKQLVNEKVKLEESIEFLLAESKKANLIATVGVADKNILPIDITSTKELRERRGQVQVEIGELTTEISRLEALKLSAKKTEKIQLDEKIEIQAERIQVLEAEKTILQEQLSARDEKLEEIANPTSINQSVSYIEEQEIAADNRYSAYFSSYKKTEELNKSVLLKQTEIENLRIELANNGFLSDEFEAEQQKQIRRFSVVAGELEIEKQRLAASKKKTDSLLVEMSSSNENADEYAMKIQNLATRGIDPIAKIAVASALIALPANGFELTKNPEPNAKRIELPIEAAAPSGLIYRVQVGAFAKPIPEERFNEFSPVSGEKLTNGITRYMAGFFNNRTAVLNAQKAIRAIGYADAFPVAYCDGKRISMDEARRLEERGECIPKGVNELMIEVTENSAAILVDDTTRRIAATKPNPLAYNKGTNSAEATAIESVQGLFFTVQLGVFNKPVSAEVLQNISPLYTKRLENGQIRYSTGFFKSADEAQPKRREVILKGIKGAFVTAYFNGQRISIQEANAILKEQGNQAIENRTPVDNKILKETDLVQLEKTQTTNTVFNDDNATQKMSDESLQFISKKTYADFPLDEIKRMNDKGLFYFDDSDSRIKSIVYKNEDYTPQIYYFREILDTVYIAQLDSTQFNSTQKITATLDATELPGDFVHWMIRLGVQRAIVVENQKIKISFSEIRKPETREEIMAMLRRFGFEVE